MARHGEAVGSPRGSSLEGLISLGWYFPDELMGQK